MAFLKFNKAELVNLSYSLRREILVANKEGAYCNTSIAMCNTRRYHGLLAVSLDRFGGDRFLLLSSLDETLGVNGKQFNLGIHCYGDIYEPRGHKYIVDFSADPVPQITYKIGEIVFRKTLLLAPDRDQLLVKYELVESPAEAEVTIRPLLPFRNIHDLTHRNPECSQAYEALPGGAAFCLYEGFPYLNIQCSDTKAKFEPYPCWYMNVTYTDEYRRGFDCKEDIYSPGIFSFKLRKGRSVILSASRDAKVVPSEFRKTFNDSFKALSEIKNVHDQLVRCADLLVTNHNGIKHINAGYSWMYTGLLRETLQALPGLTLYGLQSPSDFEEILDNLIAAEQDRLLRRTTQVEAPLYLATTLQLYIDYGADPKYVWDKYGATVKAIIKSYLPGVRSEVGMQPNGLLWAQMDGVALTWMNAYIGGRAVTERAGYQVETNSFWYNTLCFAVEMEGKYGTDASFVQEWRSIAALVKDSFNSTFMVQGRGYLADYVDGAGQHTEVRPNQLYAIWVKNSPIDEELHPGILRVVDSELVTARGIRTLSPRDVNYRGVYEGSQLERDLAYHQGCTRPSLLEPYVDVCFRIKGPAFWKKAEWLTEGFYADLSKHGVGAFSELYDGDPPHEPHGAISSALSTAALLYVSHLMNINGEDRQ